MTTVAIDFDGVIHKYSKGWQDGSIYDSAITGSIDFLEQLMRSDYPTFIFTTRTDKAGIAQWLFEQGFKTYPIDTVDSQIHFWSHKGRLGIANHKMAANIYIDDRAHKFEGTYEGMMDKVKDFKTWQGK